MIPTASGADQMDQVIQHLEDWRVKDQVIATVFDTTASNTGVRMGCAALIEAHLNRAILWLACRHHIYELHLRHVVEAVAGKANSPFDQLFKRFQREWDDLDQDVLYLRLYDWPLEDKSTSIEAKSTLKWGEECLLKQ